MLNFHLSNAPKTFLKSLCCFFAIYKRVQAANAIVRVLVRLLPARLNNLYQNIRF